MLAANHYQFSAFVTFLVNSVLLWIVVKQGKRSELVKKFSLYCSSIIVWSLFVTLATTVDDPHRALFFSQVCHMGANRDI